VVNGRSVEVRGTFGAGLRNVSMRVKPEACGDDHPQPLWRVSVDAKIMNKRNGISSVLFGYCLFVVSSGLFICLFSMYSK
jgi:hypothetical protein